MISARMSRRVKVLLVSGASLAVAVFGAACGTEKITVPKSSPAYAGAVIFSQRCGGCHTLSYAGTHGSATNIRTRLPVNGPNFNIRCERPAIRVLYAIENGGFSGAIMPQNIVVGQQAREVADFVSTYAGRQGTPGVGSPTCQSQAVGPIPVIGQALPPASAFASTTTTTPSVTTTTTTTTPSVTTTTTPSVTTTTPSVTTTTTTPAAKPKKKPPAKPKPSAAQGPKITTATIAG
jgi:hypothetical protein